ncbi:RNA-binding domain-containing protein [Streptomyces sp. A0958]|uniref:AlbA family DNA-binding domain-containing protein n=1 Tax=Streptomyces sp. A0958 TaxID=2563101 RepID=UPI001445EB5F|nr:RNA-binding domain-containing protein [Streptomyces sp. A0958]
MDHRALCHQRDSEKLVRVMVELAKGVAAMANTRGRLNIFGVQDKTIALMGIAPDQVNRQQYDQWSRNHVQPYLPDLRIFEPAGGTKTVLIVDVPAGEMAPHFVYGTAAKDKAGRPWSFPARATTIVRRTGAQLRFSRQPVRPRGCGASMMTRIHLYTQ